MHYMNYRSKLHAFLWAFLTLILSNLSLGIQIYTIKLKPKQNQFMGALVSGHSMTSLQYIFPEEVRLKLKSEGYITYELAQQPYDIVQDRSNSIFVHFDAPRNNHFETIPQEQYIYAFKNDGRDICTRVNAKLMIENQVLYVENPHDHSKLSLIEALTEYINQTQDNESGETLEGLHTVQEMCKASNVRLLFEGKLASEKSDRLSTGYITIFKAAESHYYSKMPMPKDIDDIEVAIIQYDHYFAEYLSEKLAF
jgi:hypothetical protein